MKHNKLEQKLLEKMKSKELDGILPGEIKWKSHNCICRKVIVEGIPCFISIDTGPLKCYPKVMIEQYYETDEMKLWFLKHHGQGIADPDVAEYCRLRSWEEVSAITEAEELVL